MPRLCQKDRTRLHLVLGVGQFPDHVPGYIGRPRRGDSCLLINGLRPSTHLTPNSDNRRLGATTLRGRVYSLELLIIRTTMRDTTQKGANPGYTWLARSFGRGFADERGRIVFFASDVIFTTPFLRNHSAF